MMEKIFRVSGMHCKSCGMLLQDAVAAVGGVAGVSVDYKAGTVAFSCGSERAAILVREAIEAEGYSVVG